MRPFINTPTTAATILQYNALHFPDETAFIFEGERRTNRELLDRASRLARSLEDIGVTPCDRVGMLSRNNIEFFEVYGAGFLGGATIATVNYRLAGPEMAFILNDCSPRVLIFEDHYSDVVDSLRPQLGSIERYICIGDTPDWATRYEDFIAGASNDAPTTEPLEGDPAVLIYTSGTTGKPKGCIHTHTGLGSMARIMQNAQHAHIGEKFLIVMPIFHVGGLGCGLAHLAMTGTCIIMRDFEAEAVIDTIERERINLALLAPTMVQMLLDSPRCEQADLSSLHTLCYSASPMPSNTLRAGLKRFGQIFVQYYGQTEVIATYLPRSLHKPDGTPEEQALLLSAGIPQQGLAVRIIDENGNDCQPGQPGEILAKSPSAAVGYWNASGATYETFRNGWVHTGDIGRFDERGFLFIVDRLKDVIISGGENIYSREVEEALVQHGDIAEAAVVGRPDPQWGEAVCAIVRLRPGATLTEADVIEHVRQQIASYKKPRHVIFVEELPKLVSGKVDKKELRKLAG